jgi:release factor glutamine methyltransferase
MNPAAADLMTVAMLLAEGQLALRAVAADEARLEAEVLLRQLLKIDRAELYANLTEPVDDALVASYRELLGRRHTGEPLAYITRRKQFYGHDFYVDKNVLIPRPETEQLVELSIALLCDKGLATGVIADVGTGSGIVAVSLALALPQLRVWAIDNSLPALFVARTNTTNYKLIDRVRRLPGNLLAPLAEPVDAIIANLPYTVLAEVEPAVLLSEPWAALDGGGADGFNLYRRMLTAAPVHLKPGGFVACEIGYNQGPVAVEVACASFPAANIAVQQDLAGHDRILLIET